MRTYGEGFVANQQQLLQDIVDGLDVYNSAPDPIIDRFTTVTLRETSRVSQAPIDFTEEGEGANPDRQKQTFRLLSFPLRTFDALSGFTRTGLEDALPSDILATMEAGMKGDAERVMGLFFSSVFIKRTAGAVGTAYQASFWNGETDVPSFGENTFGSAHFHYNGTNNATLSRDHIIADVENLVEHGFGQRPGSLWAFFNPAQMSDVLAVMDPTSNPVQGTLQRQVAIDRGILNTNVTLHGVNIAFHQHVPAGYYCILDEDAKPVARREHLNPEFRGLRMFQDQPSSTSPLLDMKWRRRIGFAARILGAGVARQIVASTTYTNPTMRFT
jgi:hypothetical protein